MLKVHCECTVVVRAGKVPSLPDLRALLRERFGQQAEQGKLRYAAAQPGPLALSVHECVCDGVAVAIPLRIQTCVWSPGNVGLGSKYSSRISAKM